jgi:hypothetical protein
MGSGSARCGSRSDVDGMLASELPELRRLTVVGLEAEEVPVDPEDHAVRSAAEPCGALDQCSQDQRKVERRAADRFEDFFGRRLAFERTRQLSVPRLELLE